MKKSKLMGKKIGDIKKIIRKNINNYKNKNKKINITLKQESFILHVCCKDIESAKNLIRVTNKLGVRRSGIVSINDKNERIIVEIIGCEHFETIVVKDGKVVVDDYYLKIVIDEANNRLQKNHKKLEQFYRMLKKEL